MAKKQVKTTKISATSTVSEPTWTDFGALLLALWFVFSVIKNLQDLLWQGQKNSPAIIALLLCIALIGLSIYKSNKFSLLSMASASILATSGVIWLFGFLSA